MSQPPPLPRPRPRRPWLVPLLLALILALAACVDGGGGDGRDASDGDGGAEGEQPQALDIGTGTGPLPEASFPDLRDPDRQVRTTDWEGTPTVINFWATWCTFCLEEMPALQAASERLGDRVRFVGIDRQDPRDEALAFLEETGVTYEQVASPTGEYYEAVGARGMPTTLFVDADGVMQFRHTGPLTEPEVLELVAEHLGVTP